MRRVLLSLQMCLLRCVPFLNLTAQATQARFILMDAPCGNGWMVHETRFPHYSAVTSTIFFSRVEERSQLPFPSSGRFFHHGTTGETPLLFVLVDNPPPWGVGVPGRQLSHAPVLNVKLCNGPTLCRVFGACMKLTAFEREGPDACPDAG